jgi:hypothetical protein
MAGSYHLIARLVSLEVIVAGRNAILYIASQLLVTVVRLDSYAA